MTMTKAEQAIKQHESYLRYKLSGRTKIYQKTNRVKHRDKRNAYTTKWHKEHLDHEKKYRKGYEHTEAGISRRRKYYQEHKDELRERNREYYKKWHSSPQQRVRDNIRTQIIIRLKKRLSKKSVSVLKCLDYSIDKLMEHLESLFQPGMSWDNYGKWHIDHKIPDCAFNYGSEFDDGFKRLWALDNLQPLWAHDNRVKSGKYITEA